MRDRLSAWFRKEGAMPKASGSSLIPKKILVPIDFSPSSEAALKQASALAQQLHAEIHLVHVIPMFTATKMPDYIPESEFIGGAKKEAERHFAGFQADLASKGIKVSSSIEVGNDVTASILDVIRREHIDMLVVSTHGLTGWHPLVFGSIAEKLVKLVHIPVLLIRTAKPESSA
jgi:nucleotide-binding universal stress UspA family protein